MTIPSRIDELPVTEIGDNAFQNQAGITNFTFKNGGYLIRIGNYSFSGTRCNEINLPNSVMVIGDGAFKNCGRLTSIYSLSNVRYIGKEAFAGCNSLSNITIPSNLINIGDRAFADCNNLNISVSASNQLYSAEANILYNKNKTKLISACKISSEVEILDTVSEILPYAFEKNSNLDSIHFKHNPIIGEFAFANCPNLDAVYFYSYDVPTALGSSCFSNNDFTLYTPYISQESYEYSFAEYATPVDSIAVQVSFISDGEVLSFSDDFFGSVIGNLPNPTKIGYDFQGWFDNVTYEGETYQNGGLWNTTKDLSLYAKWKAKKYVIFFSGEQSVGLEPKIVTYNSEIGALPSVTRDGYTFLGWQASSGEYLTENYIWTKIENVMLTPDWKANEYTLTFDGNGGTSGIASQPAEYGATIESLAICDRVGYDFVGWNTAADGSGQDVIAPLIYTMTHDTMFYAQWQIIEYSITYDLSGGVLENPNPSTYTILSENIRFNSPGKVGYAFVNWTNEEGIITVIETGSFGDLNLTANFAANRYTVILDANGGAINGETIVTVTYDSEYSTTAEANRTGYIFEGWYDTNQVKYMTAAGDSTKLWDITSNTMLYAHWAVKSYGIQINNDGTITWLGASGLSNIPCSIEYGTVLNAINLIATFKQSSQGYKEGKIFDRFEYNGANMDWTSVPDLGENGKVVTIIPKWEFEEHTIYFNTMCEIVLDEIKKDYDSEIRLPVNIDRNGRIFRGWYRNVTDDLKISWLKMPDLTPSAQNNGSITLYAKYDLIPFNVTYHLDGGTNSPDNPLAYTIESIFVLKNPLKTGDVFRGWFLNANWTVSVTELRNCYGDKDIYAKWIPAEYDVVYHSNTHTGSDIKDDSHHIYNVAKNLRPNSFAKMGYHFIGWATTENGSAVYSNSQSVINLTNTDNAIIDLYAVWEPNAYTVNYDANGGIGAMSPSLHTVDVIKNLNLNQFIRSGYDFDGWAFTWSESAFVGDGEGVKNLSVTQNEIVTLYAKWSLITYKIYYDFNGVDGVSNKNPYNYTCESNDIELILPIGFTGTFNQNRIPTGSTGDKYISLNLTPINYKVQIGFYWFYDMYSPIRDSETINLKYNEVYEYSAPIIPMYSFMRWSRLQLGTDEYSLYKTIRLHEMSSEEGTTVFFYCIYGKDASCVAEGSQITLSDGTQKAVEDLTGSEQLLVWNLFTGTFDTAPILFIDSDPAREYEVINLNFSDGTNVKVISEHGFWDFNLNEYVFLRSDAAKYVGHWFNKQTTDAEGNLSWTRVQLESVAVQTEYTTAWSPVTYGHLCYYVNGMLSMPGATTGLINIFDVNPDTMKIDQAAYLADIEEYGLFTYEEFSEVLPVPVEIFEAFGAQYFKVAMGKGILTWEMITSLVERYAKFF